MPEFLGYDVENIFTYHPPFGTQQERYVVLRNYARVFAEAVLGHCPGSAERTLALRKIEEAVMWANSAIARNEKPPGSSPEELPIADRTTSPRPG